MKKDLTSLVQNVPNSTIDELKARMKGQRTSYILSPTAQATPSVINLQNQRQSSVVCGQKQPSAGAGNGYFMDQRIRRNQKPQFVKTEVMSKSKAVSLQP